MSLTIKKQTPSFFATNSVKKMKGKLLTNDADSLAERFGRATQIGLLLAHGTNLCQMPFLQPTVTHMGTSGS